MRAQQAAFVPPVDGAILLSGNFGEIRSNHFHGGLDFKTGGAIGKPVRALADGYISRIRVTHGSGYVLDVTYGNRYTTINRHLDRFTGAIAARVDSLQYALRSWEVEIVPRPDEYPVKAGQQIAWSGNTGYSFGPHLHLDLLETDTGDYIDPLPFFRQAVKDHTAPRAVGIRLFPQTGKGVARGMEAWGVIGVGIRAYDYMDGVHNRYGVHTVTLEVDGTEVFRSVVDRFAQRESRLINAWTSEQYMKSFIEPGNTLRMLRAANGNRGLITIDEERPYRLRYTLSDALGNTTRVSYTIQGRRMEIPQPTQREKYIFGWDKANLLQEPGLTLAVPRGNLYNDAYLNFAVQTTDSNDIAFTYRLNDTPIPLQERAELRIGVRRRQPADSTKYYVAGIDGKGKRYSVGGVYRDGYMHTTVRELGTYTVAVDTVPPVLTPVNPARWGTNGRITYKVKEEETGIRSYRGTIDGEYVPFGIPNSISGNIVYRIDPQRIKRGKHVVELTVTDECGNTTTVRNTFNR
ncbi:MAG: M23 family metallopeptidase [Prevotellaceae bacterium]|nr:M23 family metallopeptidase [Prevotellaceae bacterium]